ncbi:MAG: TolC family protein [Treponema sp.]|nr:TolC family protein [Treponema sp.]
MRKLSFYGLIALSAVCALSAVSAQEQTASSVAEPKVLTYESAVQQALSNSYTVLLKQAALQQAHAKLTSVKAGTDVTVGADMSYAKSHTPYDDDPYYGAKGLEDIESDSLTSSVWAKKVFAFGLQSKLSFDVTRSLNTYQGTDAIESKFKDDYGTEHHNTGTMTLAFSLPLFKSFTQAVLANNIRAAKDTYRQMEYELVDTVCQTLLSASSAYWSYLTAYNTMQNQEAMQRILGERADSMDRLIQTGVRSRNDLLSMRVNQIENERNVVASRIAFEQARLVLLEAMGCEDATLPAPDYTLPAFDFAKLALPAADKLDDAFISRVCSIRPDIQALEKQLAAAESALRAASAGSRPDAALNFSVGATGAVYGDSVDDYVHSFVKNVSGNNIAGGLSFSMSLPNNAHAGSTENALASCRQAKILLSQAKNTLSLQLANTLSKLREYHTQVVQANDALSLQKQLYANEQRRFDSGLITTDDMANQDAKYLDAQTQYYKVMITYLQAVLEYKYYTGSLVGITAGDERLLIKENLYRIE